MTETMVWQHTAAVADPYFYVFPGGSKAELEPSTREDIWISTGHLNSIDIWMKTPTVSTDAGFLRIYDAWNPATGALKGGGGDGATNATGLRAGKFGLLGTALQTLQAGPTMMPKQSTLIVTANPSAADTVTIDGTTYTFRATVGSTANEVLLGSNAIATLYNLRDAINQVESKAGITYGKGTTRNVKVECVDKPVARVAVGGSRLTVRARRDYLYYTPNIAVSASGATLSWSLANLGTTTAGYGIIASNGGSPGTYGTGYAAATTEVTGLVPVKIVNIAAANELISVPLDLPINYGAILEFVLPDIAVAAAPNNISWSFSLNWEPRCRGFERMRSAFMLEKSVY